MGALIETSVLELVENTPDEVGAQLAIGVSLIPLHSGIFWALSRTAGDLGPLCF
jgi:hypothetical protein